jgi:hypothetical protein
VQLVGRELPGESPVVRPEGFAALREADHLRPEAGIDLDAILASTERISRSMGVPSKAGS